MWFRESAVIKSCGGPVIGWRGRVSQIFRSRQGSKGQCFPRETTVSGRQSHREVRREPAHLVHPILQHLSVKVRPGLGRPIPVPSSSWGELSACGIQGSGSGASRRSLHVHRPRCGIKGAPSKAWPLSRTDPQMPTTNGCEFLQSVEGGVKISHLRLTPTVYVSPAMHRANDPSIAARSSSQTNIPPCSSGIDTRLSRPCDRRSRWRDVTLSQSNQTKISLRETPKHVVHVSIRTHAATGEADGGCCTFSSACPPHENCPRFLAEPVKQMTERRGSCNRAAKTRAHHQTTHAKKNALYRTQWS